MKLASPFSALDQTGSGLEHLPPSLEPLGARMADIYGVAPHTLLVTRGASHGLELVLRRLKINGYDSIISDSDAYVRDLCDVYGLEVKPAPKRGPIGKTVGLYRIENPRLPDGQCWDIIDARTLAVEIFPAMLVIDESLFDVCDGPSLSCLIETESNVIVLKSLSFLYGLAGARVGCAIGAAKTVQGLMKYIEPHPLPTTSIKAAEAALSVSRQLSVGERIDILRQSQKRLREHLPLAQGIEGFEVNSAPFILIKPKNLLTTQTDLKRFGIGAHNHEHGLIIGIGDDVHTDRLLVALGVAVKTQKRRKGESLRDTKETRINCLIDLNAQKPVKIDTGIGFFDHMIEQIATHGGFSVVLACEGDTHIDDHHTIEDVMLCFGEALKSALGDKIGLARFGFSLPMDETSAEVKIDLGGRPFCVFQGDFEQPLIGTFPTQMVSHAFRSLSETLKAAIHVRVEGDNDHHKVEACFKALGRALRMGLKVDGDALPSTKGFLA